MQDKLKKEIRNLIIKEFNLKKTKIKNLSTHNVENWDSFGHLRLISSIERHFKINLNQKNIVKMIDEKFINSIIKQNIK